MSQVAPMFDVLTLEELATYLRLPVEIIERQTVEGQIPGKEIAGQWRFLKTAIDDWLRSTNGRSALLKYAGAFADDENLDALRTEIYKRRGRPEIETE